MTPVTDSDLPGNGVSNAFANHLLSLYPARWRERYEDEFRDVLEQCPPSLSLVLDVCKGAVDAHIAHLRYKRSLRQQEALRHARRRRAFVAAVLLVYLSPLAATTRPDGIFRPSLRLLS